MNSNYKILLAFGFGAIVRVITKPWILTCFDENYSIHKNKIYDAIIIGSITALIQIVINNGHMTNTEFIFWIILFASITGICNYLINNQVFVTKKDFLQKLKEDYAEAIKFANAMLSNKNIEPDFKEFLLEHNISKKLTLNEINELLKKI
jgi:hypothetical protein